MQTSVSVPGTLPEYLAAEFSTTRLGFRSTESTAHTYLTSLLYMFTHLIAIRDAARSQLLNENFKHCENPACLGCTFTEILREDHSRSDQAEAYLTVNRLQRILLADPSYVKD